MGAGKGGNFGNTKGSAEQLTTKHMLDALSDALAVASLIPGLDSITDLVSIPVDLARGDYLSAAFDLLGVIPVVGEAGDTAKLARTTNRVIDGGKAAKKGKKVEKAIDVMSPSQLKRTHRLTLSKKQYNILVDDIKKSGIIEPIKYVEYKGSHYVVDGHHRLQAAKELKMKGIPAEKVSLPYKGYKTYEDLFWLD